MDENRERLFFRFLRSAPLLPNARDLGVATAPVEPWPHQLRIVRRTVERFPQSFLFCDEVGLGKTIEAALVLRQLWLSERVRRVLILVPKGLLRQWQEELHEKTALRVPRLENDRLLDLDDREIRGARGAAAWRQPILLASSQLARRPERRAQLLAAPAWDLVILDEAHHARRAADGRPGRLLELMRALPRRCTYLLTATPLQLGPSELDDLMGLLGAPEDPEKRRAFAWRSTRAILRAYHQSGRLATPVPERRPENVWIDLDPRESALYRQIDAYLVAAYQRFEARKKGLGFVMTVYRRRLTSSFAAVEISLARRLALLELRQEAAFDEIEDEDEDLDLLPTESTEALDDSLFAVDESKELKRLLKDLEDLGARRLRDSKLAFLHADLAAIFAKADRVLVFTQYQDTLDALRASLCERWRVACYSGRGGERVVDGLWQKVGKDTLKSEFAAGAIDILLCTDAASEGLNLQTCGVLINYDMPWNPMRVEQRIGRIDRLGQRHRVIEVRNYFYRDTIEAEIYRRLADRIALFQEMVGPLEPILHQVGLSLRHLAMTPDHLRGRLLEQDLAEIDRRLAAPRGLDPLATMHGLAEDLTLETPLTLAEIEGVVVRSSAFASAFEPESSDQNESGVYRLTWRNRRALVTFRAALAAERPYELELLSYGRPLFAELLAAVAEPAATSEPTGIGLYRTRSPATFELFAGPNGAIEDLETLDQACAEQSGACASAWTPRRESEVASSFSRRRSNHLRFFLEVENERRASEEASISRRAAHVLGLGQRFFELERSTLFPSTAELFPPGSSFSRLAELLPTLVAQSLQDLFPGDLTLPRTVRARMRRLNALAREADELVTALLQLGAQSVLSQQLARDPSVGGLLERLYFPLGPITSEPQRLDPAAIKPFVDAWPLFEDAGELGQFLVQVADEGLDPHREAASHPERLSWVSALGGRPAWIARLGTRALERRHPPTALGLFRLNETARSGQAVLVARSGLKDPDFPRGLGLRVFERGVKGRSGRPRFVASATADFIDFELDEDGETRILAVLVDLLLPAP